jgi:hypothetical protein
MCLIANMEIDAIHLRAITLSYLSSAVVWMSLSTISFSYPAQLSSEIRHM